MLQEQDVLHVLQGMRGPAPSLVLVDGESEKLRWSYDELRQQTDYCASILLQAGALPGDTLLLWCRDVPQFFAIFHASLRLKLCLVPLHPDQDALSVETLLARLKPHFAILDNVIAHALPQGLRRRGELAAKVLLLHYDHECWLQFATSTAFPQASKANGVGTQDTALLFHSSGTSGTPKAIHYSQAQVATFLHWQQLLFAAFPDLATSSDNTAQSPRISSLPLSHWGGLSYCLQAHLEGRCVYLCNSFSAKQTLAMAKVLACQLLFFVPAMYRELLFALREGDCPSSLRYFLTMGEAMASELARELREHTSIRLYTAYGMSEALSGLAHDRAEPWEDVPEGSCGKHCFGELKLVDAQGNIASMQGEAEGELWVRNATTIPCYRDAALLDAKYSDGWYRTGDLFRRDARGHFFFVARGDDMCVHNGRNVYPQQIEAVFTQHAGIRECIAAPITTREGMRRLALLAVADSDTHTPTQLMDHYLQRGALYAAPVFLHLTDAMPATASGKPDRKSVARVLQEAYGRSAS